MERKAHETLQFLHDMRPDKAGQKAVRPAVPESRAQRLLLGKLASKIALLWQLRLSEGFAIPAGHERMVKGNKHFWFQALMVVRIIQRQLISSCAMMR